jgi:hypothetical protein
MPATEEFYRSKTQVRIAVIPPHRPLTPSEDNMPEYEVIKDICSTIHQARQSGSGLGLCLDLQGQLRGVYPVDGQSPAFSGRAITLEELLTGLPLGNGPTRKLTDEDRYILAVALASSFLQLNRTPWLRDQWSKKDSAFLRTEDGSRGTVNVAEPFVTQTYTVTIIVRKVSLTRCLLIKIFKLSTK